MLKNLEVLTTKWFAHIEKWLQEGETDRETDKHERQEEKETEIIDKNE